MHMSTGQVPSKAVWGKAKRMLCNSSATQGISFLNYESQMISDVKDAANVIEKTLSEISNETSYPSNFIVFKKNEEQKPVASCILMMKIVTQIFYIMN